MVDDFVRTCSLHLLERITLDRQSLVILPTIPSHVSCQVLACDVWIWDVSKMDPNLNFFLWGGGGSSPPNGPPPPTWSPQPLVFTNMVPPGYLTPCHPGEISLLLYTWFEHHDNVDTTSTIQLDKSPEETLTKSEPQVGKSDCRIFSNTCQYTSSTSMFLRLYWKLTSVQLWYIKQTSTHPPPKKNVLKISCVSVFCTTIYFVTLHQAIMSGCKKQTTIYFNTSVLFPCCRRLEVL